ncbi:hypothetical protein imdm_1275 [gamma proteobacterium IMCC2047]|nr:hypothetical protein imdm_1275 [gamma proteobacterium IMCC2047]
MSAGEQDINTSDQQLELERLERLAYFLDASLDVPFTNFRIGIDSLIGLIPGIGDAASGLISLAIIYRGWRLGASFPVVVRMLLNLLLDVVVGTIPVAGDLFDMAFKANLRNVDLIRNNLRKQEF